jgi:hypothetical protein
MIRQHHAASGSQPAETYPSPSKYNASSSNYSGKCCKKFQWINSEASFRRSRRMYCKADREFNLLRGSWVVDVDATEATEKPEHHQNNQDQAKNAAEAGPTVAIVAIVATATAQENN